MKPAHEASKTLEIPNIAPDASRLLHQIMDPELDVQALQHELQSVSGIVAKLIALANSAWSKPVKPITDLNAACVRLGLGVVRTVSLGLIVGKSLDTSRCQNFEAIRFWTSSIVCSDTCALLSAHFEIETNTARTIGLLHNLGLLLLADRFPEQFNSALQDDTGASLDQRLEAQCGFGYWEAGYRVLAHWGVPDIIADALQNPDDIDEPASIAASKLTHFAANLSNRITRQEEIGDLTADFLDPLALQTVYAEQVANYESNLELTRTLFT